jgi:predicted branched-subunit amino acid permease
LIPNKLNLKNCCLGLGLTDEVFASGMIQLSQRKQQWSESWMLGLSLFSWMSWALVLVRWLICRSSRTSSKVFTSSFRLLITCFIFKFFIAAFERNIL